MQPSHATGTLLVVLLVSLLQGTQQQGLQPDARAAGASSTAAQTLSRAYQASRAWNNNFKVSKQTCSARAGLCASNAGPNEQVQLLVATTPARYDARLPAHTGGWNAVSRVKEQGVCWTCTSFAILGALEAAVASSLGQDAANLDLSVQDLHFCASKRWSAVTRSCFTPVTLKEGLELLLMMNQNPGLIVNERCLPYNPTPITSATQDQQALQCSCRCREVDTRMANGNFGAVGLGAPGDIQRWVAQFGAVITQIDLYDDMRPFFKANPQGVYRGPRPGAKLTESHAALIVGWDMDAGYWLLKNSWGQGFADGGLMRVAHGVASVASPGFTFGVSWLPKAGLTRLAAKSAAILKPIAGRPSCYAYTVQSWDFIARLADTFNIPVSRILLDNSGAIPDLDSNLVGRQLVLCGLNSAFAQAASSEQASVAAAQAQAAALRARVEETIRNVEATLNALPNGTKCVGTGETVQAAKAAMSACMGNRSLPGGQDKSPFAKRVDESSQSSLLS